MATVIPFPTEAQDLIGTIRGMYEDGTVREIVIFAPNAKDREVVHFKASAGIRLSDLLMARRYIEALIDKFDVDLDDHAPPRS